MVRRQRRYERRIAAAAQKDQQGHEPLAIVTKTRRRQEIDGPARPDAEESAEENRIKQDVRQEDDCQIGDAQKTCKENRQ